jgi:hypothetical protein
MDSKQVILEQMRNLTLVEQEELLDILQRPEVLATVARTPRIPDLMPGIEMGDDFDEPLPDELWLGTD